MDQQAEGYDWFFTLTSIGFFIMFIFQELQIRDLQNRLNRHIYIHTTGQYS